MSLLIFNSVLKYIKSTIVVISKTTLYLGTVKLLSNRKSTIMMRVTQYSKDLFTNAII